MMEVLKAVGRCLSEVIAQTIEAGTEGLVVLEPEVNGGAVDTGLAGGGGDSRAGEQMVKDPDLFGTEGDIVVHDAVRLTN